MPPSASASILVFLFLFICSQGLADFVPRKISVQLNPNCDAPSTCDNDTTLVHIRSVGGASDELHFLWDFTGQPAALVLAFNGSADLTVDWAALLDGRPSSVKFSRTPSYYFGIVLQSLFVYDDVADGGHLDDAVPTVRYPLQDFTWTRRSLEVDEDEQAKVVVAGREFNRVQSDGRKVRQPLGDLQLSFTTYTLPGHSEQIPHLLHTENATEIDLVLKELRLERNFSCPRVALGVSVLSLDREGPSGRGNFSLNIRRSLDDEFTPGIFELINVAAQAVEHDGGFVQYRPVSYTDEAREVSTSTAVTQSEPKRPENAAETLAETIFATVDNLVLERASVASMNVSFGVSGDGCFGKTNYTTWTFVTAYGQPMPERLSTLVVVVAALGLGIPLLLMISGGCYVCLKKARES